MSNEAKMLSLVSDLANVKSEQNILAALAIYHPEIELLSPSFNAHAKGSEEVKQQLNVFFSLFPDYDVTLDQHAINGNVMLATGQAWITLTIPEKKCPRIQMPVFIEFHFHEDRISKEIFFLDAGMVCKKSGVTPKELAQATYRLKLESTDNSII